MRQKTVGKGQHGVDSVQRRTAAASPEKEIFLFIQNQMVKYAKINACSDSFQASQSLHVGYFQNLGH